MATVVTGGAGFIGSNLVRRLIKDGNNVTVIDNLHTGSKENLTGVNVNFINANSGDGVKQLKERVEKMFHQGVYSSSPMYKNDPTLLGKVVDEFIKVLEYCRKNETKLVFASTSSMYGGYEPPHNEKLEVRVTDYYTEGRYYFERLAELYHKLYGMNIVGLRYFSVYGPYEQAKKQYANLITQFLWDMKQGKSPVVYGDGEQKRDFTYVDDIVEGNLLAMNSKKHGNYNLGTGVTTTVNDMIKILNQKMNTNIEPKYIENKVKNYVTVTRADTSKSERELGFRAKISLEKGIEKIIQFYS